MVARSAGPVERVWVRDPGYRCGALDTPPRLEENSDRAYQEDYVAAMESLRFVPRS
mgnify:FL=1